MTDEIVDQEELDAFCERRGGYEILSNMMLVDAEELKIELIPRSRQELLELVDVSQSSIERRTTEGCELGVLVEESGESYAHLPDLRRVYRIKEGVIAIEKLQDIKMKGYRRQNPIKGDSDHADVPGGVSQFLFGDDYHFDDFVREFLSD